MTNWTGDRTSVPIFGPLLSAACRSIGHATGTTACDSLSQSVTSGWVYFVDAYPASSGYTRISAGDIATDWAYGGTG